MSDRTQAELLAELVLDPRARALLKRARDDYLSWDEFLHMELPPGMSAMGTWELLAALHRTEAIGFPDIAGGAGGYWYSLTHAIAGRLSEIDRSCSEGSCLFATVTATAGRPFLVTSRINDVVAAAHMDGLDISVEAARDLLHLERAPRDDVERLLVNTVAVTERLPAFAHRPFSPELLHEFRELLLEGLSSSALPKVRPAMGLVHEDDFRVSGQLTPEERMAYVCGYANNEIGDPYDHPAVRALALADMMRSHHPLPDMNTQVGRLMTRLYSLKNGLPVLGLLPITRAQALWELDRAPYSDVSVQREQYMSQRGADILNATLYVSLLLELVVIALRELQDAVREAEEQDARIKDHLNIGPGLNHRQRSILGRAVRDPDAQFRIGYHKTNHGITYATARKDLVGLEQAGYLVSHSVGHAFVFTPAPDLKEKLGVRG